ncbi:lysocardiolipin acyltransferase 1 [Phyllostomus discolor]|uniref:Lysocardiolipin acyltransferase 1 n=1 Tax=Phyllostomus discolor TaxID=89673 RepID=A0A834A401_9CHIR|nr:lysocardiolipin acyltransferase 1 [Phyllostomus discolor]
MVSWKGIYFILTLFWGSFFGSIFMLGPFLPLMAVSPSWYRWINNRLVATWLTLPVALLETMFGVKVIITGDAFVPGERSVIIMNHRTRMDWMFLWNCLMRYSYLRLEKVCLKASLKSVPGFGWAMQAAAYIFIHRKWKDDKSHFEDMIDYFCDIREPLQLLIFPEGTDLTENSKARSNDFAEKNGLQKYEYVLHPRTTGFTFVVDRLREARTPRKRCRLPVATSLCPDSFSGCALCLPPRVPRTPNSLSSALLAANPDLVPSGASTVTWP